MEYALAGQNDVERRIEDRHDHEAEAEGDREQADGHAHGAAVVDTHEQQRDLGKRAEYQDGELLDGRGDIVGEREPVVVRAQHVAHRRQHGGAGGSLDRRGL